MESQNKNLKSIFFNFLLLLAFIFSVMALYISLSFSEKITDQGQDVIKDDLNLEFQKLNHSISELEKKGDGSSGKPKATRQSTRSAKK